MEIIGWREKVSINRKNESIEKKLKTKGKSAAMLRFVGCAIVTYRYERDRPGSELSLYLPRDLKVLDGEPSSHLAFSLVDRPC